MANWDPTGGVVCAALANVGSLDDLCFPGGFCLSHVWQGIDQVPHLADMWLQFYSQIGPAMAFMKPFFTAVDTVLAVFRCVQAVPDAITNLDPTELFQCMPELVEKVNELLSMLPYLSIPRMVKALIHGLAGLLRGIASDLSYIKQQLQRIADAIDEAADLNDVTWSGLLSCAEQTVEDMQLSTAEALKGIGRIILLTNILLSLLSGAPEVPCFGTLMEDVGVIDDLIGLLTDLANLLDALADKIPDPQVAITLLLGDQRC